LLGLITFAAQPYFPPPLPQETGNHGWLIPANDPTPPNSCTNIGVPVTQAALTIILGDGAAIWTIDIQEMAEHCQCLNLAGGNFCQLLLRQMGY